MKPKYKVGSWLKHNDQVREVLGVHVNIYNENASGYVSNVQYEFDYDSGDWIDEDEIDYEMVKKS